MKRFINSGKTLVFMGLDKGLEGVLKSIFEVDSQKAEQAAKTFTLDGFELNFKRLENILDFDGAAEVVRNGDFLTYRNSQLEKYFQLATVVISKMDRSLPIPIKPFYSIVALEGYLGISEEASAVIEHSKLKLAPYRILHRDNPQSVAYLDSLIENGEINADRNGYWSRSKGAGGIRGLHILQRIAFEIIGIFNDLKLDRPVCNIYHGQLKITIDGNTREALRKVRDLAYSIQQ